MRRDALDLQRFSLFGVGIAAAGMLLLGIGTASSAPVQLAQQTTAPGRPHLLRPGTETSYVFELFNDSLGSRSYDVAVELLAGQVPDWSASLALADDSFRPVGASSGSLALHLSGLERVSFLVRLVASPTLADGEQAQVEVTASSGQASATSLTVSARVRDKAKIYYVAIDAAGRNYLRIGRDGNWYDGSNERLMPRAWEFLSRGAFLSRAKGELPATTDGNHAAALAGSWPGTLGIFSVKNHYLGTDADAKVVVTRATKRLLRWGLEGKPVTTVFDMAKDPAVGGDPEAFNALVTGKAWVADLFQESDGVVDLLGSGTLRPSYFTRPQRYRTGDPESDPDAAIDREGTNPGPWLFKKIFSWQALAVGANPSRTPEDRWIASQAMRVIAAEDPDVLYVLLAECDTAQHIFGAADQPEEWDDRGTPGILWDDVNVYNRQANRDPVLDIVHEADASFGLIMDFLASRNALDPSYVVLLSDHGQTTVMHTKQTVLDVNTILENEGVQSSQIERLVSAGQFAWIALNDPNDAAEIESKLEAHEEYHPTLERNVKPFIVLNRTEMDDGVDNVEGSISADGVLGNLRGELYSAWSIDVPTDDNSKIRWPDLMVFTRYHFQTSLLQATRLDGPDIGTIFNGHHAAPSTTQVILGLRGPGIESGVYDVAASLVDVAPTLYRLLGMPAPENVDGEVLESILKAP